MTPDARRAFEPSARFVAIHGTAVEPRAAERLLVSVLYNHDTVPDLVTLTCELALAIGHELTYREAAAIASVEGVGFDAEGWFASAPTMVS